MAGAIARRFGVHAAGSTVPRELGAGVTTFLTMAYVLFVNPDILGNAIRLPPGSNTFGQLLTATAVAAAVGSLLMGLLARYPFALAPGMGINAYFAFTVVLGQGIPWQAALGAVFLSGSMFLVLSLVGAREAIIAAIPVELRLATAAGIGMFLALLGLQHAGIVVASPATMVTLGDLTAPAALLAELGLLATAVMLALRVRGAILFGIALTAAAAIVTGAPVYQGEPFAGFSQGIVRAPAWPVDLFLALDLRGALDLGLVGIVFTFLFVDLFDTAGTLMGLADKAGVTGEGGRLPRATAAFSSDAVATCTGALLGTSTTTAYIESAAGLEAGGRTGLVAVTVAGLFALSIFLWPLAAAVPSVATAPALIVVGAMMLPGLRRIAWDEPRVAIPAFLTVIGIPLTFSIANGICFGIIAWAAVHLLSGRPRGVHWLLYALAAALVARYAWLGAG